MKNLIVAIALSFLAFSCNNDDNGKITEVINTNNNIEYLGYEAYTRGIYNDNTCIYALRYHLRNKTNKEINVSVIRKGYLKKKGYNVNTSGKLNNYNPVDEIGEIEEKKVSIKLPANGDGWVDEKYTCTGSCGNSISSVKPRIIVIQ